MKKLIALTMALSILSGVGVCTGSVCAADPPYSWGSTTSDVFSDMQQLDDKGMLAWVGRSVGLGTEVDYKVFTKHVVRDDPEVELDFLYVAHIYDDRLRFVLRSDLDEAEARQQAAEIIKQYYPTLAEQKELESTVLFCMVKDPLTPEGTYELSVPGEQKGDAETADALMRELANAGLISEFYSWGQIARYQNVEKYSGDAGLSYDTGSSSNTAFDSDAVAEYLLANGFDCTIEKGTEHYRIIPKEEMTFVEEFALAADLHEAYGYRPEYVCPASVDQTALGTNSLAVDGDINLDCSIDIADSVLLSRFIAEDKEIQITSTGVGNSDLDKDGNITMSDVSVLLRNLAHLD